MRTVRPHRPLRAGACRGLERLGPRARQRGSTVLLVITILSLLVLLAITLTFTSRMELSASKNFGIGVQNRVASRTAVEAIAIDLQTTLPAGALGPLDLAFNPEFSAHRARQTPSGMQRIELASLSDRDAANLLREAEMLDGNAPRTAFHLLHNAGAGEVVVLDASARININAADEAVLAGFFNALGRREGRSINGDAIGRAIARVRLGPDGAPGRAGIDDNRNADAALAFAPHATAHPGAQTPLVEQGSPNRARFDAYLQNARAPLHRLRPDQVQRRFELRRDLLTMVDEPEEYIADIRLPAFGDDVRFSSTSDLLHYPAIRGAGLNEEVLELARPYLTVFSTSVKERNLKGEGVPFVDINRAGPEELYQALREIYPGKNDRLLKQFAVNIVDARDFNSIPTVYPGTSGASVILGVERTPFLTEVYPDALTPGEDGDGGQFVELHNPWDETMDVNGWRLEGPGGSWPLSGVIPAGGFLLVTDNMDGRSSSTEDLLPGTGSVYDIFRVVADGWMRRAIEHSNFDIPLVPGSPVTLNLKDQHGNLIDSFTFVADPRDEDSLYSYQRENPMVREAVRRRATPFAMPPRLDPVAPETLARLRSYPPDAPFTSPVELMDVFAGFNDPETQARARWAFPVVSTPYAYDRARGELAAHPLTIDARVLDVFAVSNRPMPSAEEWHRLHGVARGDTDPADRGIGRNAVPGARTPGPDAGPITASTLSQEFSLHSGDPDWATRMAVEALSPPPGVIHGRVNINTADALVLSALPGLTPQGVERILERRLDAIERVRTGGGGEGVAYRTLSEILGDDALWPANLGEKERLERFSRLLPHITLNSRGFLLVGQPRVEATSDRDQQRAARLEALVALDRGTPEILYLRKAASRP